MVRCSRYGVIYGFSKTVSESIKDADRCLRGARMLIRSVLCRMFSWPARAFRMVARSPEFLQGLRVLPNQQDSVTDM